MITRTRKANGARPYSDQQNWSNDYLTPRALVRALGPFDTDPCCPQWKDGRLRMPWRTARRMITPSQDGLQAEWRGRVWMNPPYRGVRPWAHKFALHGNGIALINGRAPETAASQTMMKVCSALYILNHRLMFCWPTGKPTEAMWFPSILIGMSRLDRARLIDLQDHPEFGGVCFDGPMAAKRFGRTTMHPRNAHTRSLGR